MKGGSRSRLVVADSYGGGKRRKKQTMTRSSKTKVEDFG